MSSALANPAEMIAKGAPHVIHNHRELKEYTEALFRLTALNHPSHSEIEAIESLSLLIERYEKEQYHVPVADPVSIVRFILDQQGLLQRDIIPQFGSESAVSMFLSGHRRLTLEQVKALSTRFNLPADIFIAGA